MQLLNTLNTGCCNLVYSIYKYKNYHYKNKPKRKGGIIVYDDKKKKILIVQSNGYKWGIPKGSIDPNENIEDCAIREVFEETGLLIPKSKIQKFIQIHSRSYYIAHQEMCPITSSSDATGIGWICLECLKKNVIENKIEITRDCEIIIQKLYSEKYL